MTRAVTVAVITYRRPAALARLLPDLLAQAASLDERSGMARVLVVDNDPAASAEAVVAARAEVGYVREPVPGIAAARNRALAESDGEDLLVFIDDDETPGPGWLTALLAGYDRTGATAVTGPVTSQFEVEPEPWVHAGGFFARRHRAGVPADAELDTAASNNLLLDIAAVRSLDLRFDVDFGLSGGSDTLFSRVLISRGGRITWCPDAVVVEHVPADRLTRRWLLTRALSYGATDCRVAVRTAAGPVDRLRARVRCLTAGLARIVVGVGRYGAGSVLRSQRLCFVGLQTLLRGLGLVGAVFGYTYQRYRRPAARSVTTPRYHESTKPSNRVRDHRS